MKNKQAIINVIGNFIYLVGQFWMTIIVARCSDNFFDAGILAICMTVTNMFYIISSYGMRTYQISDIKDRFSYREYMVSRYFTICIAFSLCLVYCVLSGYPGNYIVAIILYMLYKSSEAYSDVCYGIFQRENSYNIICGSLAVKGILNIILFTISFIWLHDINFSLCLVSAICLLVNLIIDRLNINKYEKYESSKVKICSVFILLKETFPLMLGLMFPQVILAIPRLYFEKNYSTELLGIYSSISSPTIVITTFVSCAIMPFVPLMADYYQNNKIKEQIGLMMKCIVVCVITGGLMCLGSLFLGKAVLELLYGNEVLLYMDVFYLIILVTTLSAMIMCMNALYIAIRRLKLLVAVLATGTLVCACFTGWMIDSFGMKGITYILSISQVVELIMLWVLMKPCLKKKIGG